jgi:phosphoglycerate dehydrogenase-like enzyme
MKHIKLLSLAHFTEERIMALKDYAKVDRYPNNVNNRDEEEVVERLHGADIALINHVTPISRRVLDARPDLRFIVTSTVGVDHIDLEYCRERDVHVRWFPGYCARTLAEHSFTFILMGLNFIAQAMDNARNRRWDYMNFRGREAKGRRLLILGLGKTGKYLKELAECFGMNVMWTNSKTPAGEVDAMISSADVISLHMSLNPETRGFLDRRRLGVRD